MGSWASELTPSVSPADNMTTQDRLLSVNSAVRFQRIRISQGLLAYLLKFLRVDDCPGFS